MNIKQAADLFDLTTDTLRYYERVGVIPPVTRNSSGYRDFTTVDLNWVYLVKNLRSAGLSIELLIEFSNLGQLRQLDNQDVNAAQKQVLFEQRGELDKNIAHLQSVRDLLTYKIDNYEEHVAKFKPGEDGNNAEALWKKKIVKD